jgi:hypothetical protein
MFDVFSAPPCYGVGMSDVPADYRERLDLRAEIARIDRDRAESQKLQEETRKFVAEQHKLMAEGRKFNRDPWFLIIGAIIAAVATRLPEILRAVGLSG